MAVSSYRVTPARIGNSSGLRLPAAFYRDHPQFAGAAGQVEVLDDTTLLMRLEPEEQQQAEADRDQQHHRPADQPARVRADFTGDPGAVEHRPGQVDQDDAQRDHEDDDAQGIDDR